MLAELTSRQVTEWMAFYRIEQLGEEIEFRADFRAATTVINLAKAMSGKQVTEKELMPFHPVKRPGQTDEQLHAALTRRAEADAKRTASKRKASADGGDTGNTIRRAHHARTRLRARDSAIPEGSEGTG